MPRHPVGRFSGIASGMQRVAAGRGEEESATMNAVLTTFVFIVPKMCDLVCYDNNGDFALCSSDMVVFTQLMLFLSTLLRG